MSALLVVLVAVAVSSLLFALAASEFAHLVWGRAAVPPGARRFTGVVERVHGPQRVAGTLFSLALGAVAEYLIVYMLFVDTNQLNVLTMFLLLGQIVFAVSWSTYLAMAVIRGSRSREQRQD